MRRTARFLLLTLVAGLAGPAAQVATAQPRPAAEPGGEAAALAFARSHHPELAELLERLATTDRAAYEKAIRDVSQASERLARLRENDPERYDVALRLWTLDSRIRLLAARSTMSDDPAIDERLRELLRERRRVRLASLRLERTRLLTRLEKVEGQIAQLEGDPAPAVENDLTRIKREVKASASRDRRAPAKGEPATDGAKQKPSAKAVPKPKAGPDEKPAPPSPKKAAPKKPADGGGR